MHLKAYKICRYQVCQKPKKPKTRGLKTGQGQIGLSEHITHGKLCFYTYIVMVPTLT